MKLSQLFADNHTDKTKYSNVYDFISSHITPSTILEIGAFKGGSLRAMQAYYPNAKVYGIEIDPSLIVQSPDLTLFQGRQEDTAFLDTVLATTGIPDLVIDDGGHKMIEQVVTLSHILPKLASGGVYVLEDLETSYLPFWQDGGTKTTEFIKSLIDKINFYGKSHEGENAIADLQARAIDVDTWGGVIGGLYLQTSIAVFFRR